MARLSSYYTLCPLIDQQNLLGVEADSNPGCAIVTLGRNIVIRYKLQDLKQVCSWSTKDRLTAQVIFDEIAGNYIGVFNGKNIRIWQEKDENLDNVKKYKFLFPVLSVLKLQKVPPILVMQNGAIASLDWALSNRKTWMSSGLLLPNERLENYHLISVQKIVYFCALVNVDNAYTYLVVPLQENDYIEKLDQIKRIELKRFSDKLVGHVVIQDGHNAYLLTLWSHGRLYSYPLTDHTCSEVPGSLVSVITAINTKHPVVMVPLNESTIAIYGADANEEGAILMIYNVQFKLAQAIQKLKLYTNDAKLWKIEDKLLLAANRHLAVAPYRLAPQRVEAMLGSTSTLNNDDSAKDTDIVLVKESKVADWGTFTSNTESSPFHINMLDSKVCSRILTLLSEGMSDASIFNCIIPELVEHNNIESILWCLNNLKDIPEELLICLLKFCLRSTNIGMPSKNGSSDVNINEHKNLQYEFLDKILNIRYADLSLISYLRTGLGFDEILKLLDYLVSKLNEKNCPGDYSYDDNYNRKFYEWIILLIDSHYQHYLLSQDTLVLRLLNQLNETLEIDLLLMRDLENLRPMVQRIINGKPMKAVPNDVYKFYSIEEVKLY